MTGRPGHLKAVGMEVLYCSRFSVILLASILRLAWAPWNSLAALKDLWERGFIGQGPLSYNQQAQEK